MKLKQRRGFSLIEIMVGLAIVTILAAIAVPSFHRYIIEARRAEGVSQLSSLWRAQKEYFDINGIYRPAFKGLIDTPNSAASGSGASELLYSVPTYSRYVLSVGMTGAVVGQSSYYSSAISHSPLTSSGEVMEPINHYGWHLASGGGLDPRQIVIGAEADLDGDDYRDILIVDNGQFYQLCDDSNDSPPLREFIASSDGAVRCTSTESGGGAGESTPPDDSGLGM